MNYSEMAFTDAIKKIQSRMGSRLSYERMEQRNFTDGLTDHEENFLAEIDSFFMASIGDNGYPYIQHRGGPKGFVKVIDHETIGIIDFSGNRQYISAGNFEGHPKVSLIFLSYPLRARLKIYAEARVVELDENPDLYKLLSLEDYQYKPERMFVFKVEAYDWNCPQHISAKYSIEEVQEILKPQKDYIMSLEAENEELKARLEAFTNGNSPLYH